jgi:hypothetical protein
MLAIKDPRATGYSLYSEFAGLRGDSRMNEMRRNTTSQ